MSPLLHQRVHHTEKKNVSPSLPNHPHRPEDRTRKQSAVPGSRKIVDQILPGFSRRLSAMLSAGMPIVAAFTSLERQTLNPHFKDAIARVRSSIENGSSLAESLQQFPSLFSNLYINMIRGGEASGQLAEAMGRIATFLETTNRLRRKVKAALIYPVVVLCIAFVIAAGLIVFVVPVFGKMFAEFRSALPAPTQFLLDLSNWMKHYGLVLVVVVIVSGIFFHKWKATPFGHYTIDRFVLYLPVFGDLARKLASARFSRTFGQLTRSGVPILNALEISSGATGNRVAADIVNNCRDVVARGEPLSTALCNQTVFDPMVLPHFLEHLRC